VATEEEWTEFTSLPKPDETTLWLVSMAETLTVRDRAVLRSRDLWEQFANRVRDKLREGHWRAEGYTPAAGPHPLPLDPKLWRLIDFDRFENRASGGGFSFVNLLISHNRLDAPVSHATKAAARADLRRWIEQLARQQPGPMTMKQARDLARSAFGELKISDNLFKQAWSQAEKPAGFVQSGRPRN
jgi:hypothetical protein